MSIQPQMLRAPMSLAKAGPSLRVTEKQSSPPDTWADEKAGKREGGMDARRVQEMECVSPIKFDA